MGMWLILLVLTPHGPLNTCLNCNIELQKRVEHTKPITRITVAFQYRICGNSNCVSLWLFFGSFKALRTAASARTTCLSAVVFESASIQLPHHQNHQCQALGLFMRLPILLFLLLLYRVLIVRSRLHVTHGQSRLKAGRPRAHTCVAYATFGGAFLTPLHN